MSSLRNPPQPPPTQFTSAQQQAIIHQMQQQQHHHQQQQQGVRLVPPTLHHSSSSSLLLPQDDNGPPHKVPVTSRFARVTPMEPGDPFPSISTEDQARVKGWMDRDLQYEQELAAARRGKRVEIMEMAEDVLNGQDWLGPPGQPGQFRIRWDDDKDREQATKSRGSLRKPVKLSKRQLRSVASKPEVLIPIRLDIEHEAWKLRDTFTWNLLETEITPEDFASHLCADLRLPERPFVREIIKSINKARDDAQSSGDYDGYLGDAGLGSAEENRKWFDERACKKRRKPLMDGIDETEAMDVQEFSMSDEVMSEELRITIKLDITLDSMQLVDKLEWDISNPRNSPEEFAETFSAELGLTGEFRTAIAHSIREQVDNYVKSLSIVGYAPGGSIGDDDLRREFLPDLYETFRSETADDFSPNLTMLSMEELERNDKEGEREVRRKRRQTKGRGVNLPDREPVKTHRTLVPRPLPGLMQVQMNGGDTIYPLPELSYPYPIVPRPTLPKPEGLDISTTSSLRLVQKDRPAPPASPKALRGAAKANAMAKRARLEQEEEARGLRRLPGEFGLHPHVIDDKWHCANCGVPDGLAIGRRKGPTGTANLCGACGKFYQRYKKQRICQYTTDYDTHLRLRTEEESKTKSGKTRKQVNVSNVVTSTEGTPAVDDPQRANYIGLPNTASRADSPASSLPDEQTGVKIEENEDEEDDDDEDSDDSAPVRAPSRKRRRPNQYGSPDTPFVVEDSNSGSDSEEDEDDREASLPPAPSPPPPTVVQPVRSLEPVIPVVSAPQAPPTVTAPAPPPKPSPAPPEPLPWMLEAAADLRARQVDDRFELIPRAKAADPQVYEWRIRCLDCPGKLYNLGPGQTFEGFLIHFKNRNHRINVETRLANQQTSQ